MEINSPWNWRLRVLRTIKMMLVRPPMTNFRADCAVSACSPLPQPMKALAHWLTVRESWPLNRSPPSPLPVSSIQNKADFLSHQPCMCVCVCVGHLVVSDSVAPWTAACQAPLLMGFSRQEYWSGLPFPSPNLAYLLAFEKHAARPHFQLQNDKYGLWVGFLRELFLMWND